MKDGAQADFRVRAARDADSAGVIAVVAACFAEYPGCVLDVDLEEPELRTPASSFERFWVVEGPGARVVGCCGLEVRADHVELEKLYLLPEARGRGLARELVGRVEAEARARGLGRVELWSDTRFLDAHGLYAHLGYRRTGRERDLGDLSRTTEWHFERALGPRGSARNPPPQDLS